MSLPTVNRGHLATAHISMRVGIRVLLLNNRLKALHLAAISRLALPSTHHRLRLVVNGKLSGLGPGSSALVVWLVHKGKRLVAQHSMALRPLDEKFSASWAVQLPTTPGLIFSAEAFAVSMEGAITHSNVVTGSIDIPAP